MFATYQPSKGRKVFALAHIIVKLWTNPILVSAVWIIRVLSITMGTLQ
jgi:hypothetical protein